MTLSDSPAPFTRGTAYGIWLQPQGVLDVVTIVEGAPYVARTYGAWKADAWFNVTIVVTDSITVYGMNGSEASALSVAIPAQPLRNRALSVMYVASAPDQVYPRGFLARVASVGILNAAVDASIATNLVLGIGSLRCGTQPPTSMRAIPPASPPPPYSPPPQAAIVAPVIAPPSCAAAVGGPVHQWIARNVRGRVWMDDPPAGYKPWPLLVPSGAVIRMVGPKAYADVSASATPIDAGRRKFGGPFVVYLNVIPTGGSFKAFSVTTDDGVSLSADVDLVARRVFVILTGALGSPGYAKVIDSCSSSVACLSVGSWADMTFTVNTASTDPVLLYINKRLATTINTKPGNGTALAADSVRRVTLARGSVGIALARLLVGGSTAAYSAIGQAQDSVACPALQNQNIEYAVQNAVTLPLAPGALPGIAPLHWWSAAVQPGAWGLADVLVDMGNADADAPTVSIVGASTV